LLDVKGKRQREKANVERREEGKLVGKMIFGFFKEKVISVRKSGGGKRENGHKSVAIIEEN